MFLNTTNDFFSRFSIHPQWKITCFFILWSSGKNAATLKNLIPSSWFLWYYKCIVGEACLYTWLFIQLFFLGKYNQGFNNFPKSKTNLFSSFISFCEHSAILSHIFFFGRKSPTFISFSGAPKKRRGAKSFLPFSDFFCDIIRLDGEACLYIWLFIQQKFVSKR